MDTTTRTMAMKGRMDNGDSKTKIQSVAIFVPANFAKLI